MDTAQQAAGVPVAGRFRKTEANLRARVARRLFQAQGWRSTEIGKALGVSRSLIELWLKPFSIRFHRPHGACYVTPRQGL